MDCVNHSGVAAAAYCQNCGKPICAGCVRTGSGGQVFCEPCYATWQVYQQPFVAATSGTSGPNPSAAAVLGLIPGVGAMYNGQFFKGLIHVVIFAVLVSISHHHPIFGIFVAAWILYQSFEAFHTAQALRYGQRPPDPLGLNEVGNWLNLGMRPNYPGQYPGAHQNPYQSSPAAGQAPSASAQPNSDPYSGGRDGQGSASHSWADQGPTAHGPATPPPPGYQASGAYQAPPTQPDPGFVPDPSGYWRPMWHRREPVGAVILIALGLLFLLGQLDIFNGRLFHFSWPVLLIGLGVWLIIRNLRDSQGGSK
jgi:TM2 domain-containing membrane protein YozV